MLEWMVRRLQIAGMNVLAASTGEDAVAKALRENPDLALIDYRLPGIDGVATADAIRAGGVVVPWILFSAIQDSQAAFKAGQHGALSVVWTPFDVHAVARQALDTLKARRQSDWSRLLLGERLPRPETTAACAAWWILRACASRADLSTLGRWSEFIGVGYTSLREAFRRIGVEPHDARDFMRILRALVHTSGRADGVEGQLALGDLRTTRAMMDRAHLAPEDAGSVSLEHFLGHQDFVPADHDLVVALRGLIAALKD